MSVRQRTLAAIIPVEDQAWFFKISGPDNSVEAQAKAFRGLLESVRFQAENVAGEGAAQPTWKLPDGWRSLASKDDEAAAIMRRFATVEIPGEGQALEMSVTSLPRPGGNDEAYTLANVNRWRRQLQLPPLSAGELSKNCEVFQADGKTVTLVNLQGPAPANSQRPPARGAAAANEVAQGEPTFDIPEGWTKAPGDAFSLAAFEVRQGDHQARVTVSQAGGAVLANINRWRGQLGQSALTQEQLDQQGEKLKVGGLPGVYIKIDAAPGAASKQSILGVIAPDGARAWFFKFKGDTELAQREAPRFKAFVQSVKFNQAAGADDGK